MEPLRLMFLLSKFSLPFPNPVNPVNPVQNLLFISLPP